MARIYFNGVFTVWSDQDSRTCRGSRSVSSAILIGLPLSILFLAAIPIKTDMAPSLPEMSLTINIRNAANSIDLPIGTIKPDFWPISYWDLVSPAYGQFNV